MLLLSNRGLRPSKCSLWTQEVTTLKEYSNLSLSIRIRDIVWKTPADVAKALCVFGLQMQSLCRLTELMSWDKMMPDGTFRVSGGVDCQTNAVWRSGCRQYGWMVNIVHLHILPTLTWYKAEWKSGKLPSWHIILLKLVTVSGSKSIQLFSLEAIFIQLWQTSWAEKNVDTAACCNIYGILFCLRNCNTVCTS